MALTQSTDTAACGASVVRPLRMLQRALAILWARVAGITGPLRARHQLSEERWHLAGLSDRDLREIGLARDDVADAAPPSYWLR